MGGHIFDHATSDGYRLMVTEAENRRLIVWIDVGASSHAVVLAPIEALALTQKLASHFGVSSEDLPAHEPETCATHYLIAERAMRLLETSAAAGAQVDMEAIDTVRELASEAGASFARIALRDRGMDVPF